MPCQRAAKMDEGIRFPLCHPEALERPLDGAADAMRRMANRQIKGEIVILPEG